MDNDKSVIHANLKRGVQKFSRDKAFSHIGLLPLETSDNALLASVKKVLVRNDKFIILDSKQNMIFLFDRSGKFINKIDQIGKGPEEFYSVCDITEGTDGSFWALDESVRAITEYDTNGNFIRKIRLKIGVLPVLPFYMQKIGEHVFAFCNVLEKNQVVLFDIKEKKVIDILESEEAEIVNNNTPSRYVNSPFLLIGDEWHFFQKYNGTIYKITETGIDLALRYSFKGNEFVDPSKLTLEGDFRTRLRKNVATMVSSKMAVIRGYMSVSNELVSYVNMGQALYQVQTDLANRKSSVFAIERDGFVSGKMFVKNDTIYSFLNPGHREEMALMEQKLPDGAANVNINDNYYIESLCLGDL